MFQDIIGIVDPGLTLLPWLIASATTMPNELSDDDPGVVKIESGRATDLNAHSPVVGHATDQTCPLLTMLPSETRFRIWQYVLGSSMIHVFPTTDGSFLLEQHCFGPSAINDLADLTTKSDNDLIKEIYGRERKY